MQFKFLFLLAIFFLQLFFVQSSQRAIAASSNTLNPLTLAAKDLLGIENATAEDILFLAHERDTRAMSLVAAGYAKGIGGFPEDLALSGIWSRHVAGHGNIVGVSILSAMAHQIMGASAMEEHLLLSHCQFAKGSKQAIIFANSKIFDLDEYCSSVSKNKIDALEGENGQSSIPNTVQNVSHEIAKMISFIRQYALLPMDADEEIEFHGIVSEVFSFSQIPFFSTTTHNPETEAPNWDVAKLLLLLESCRASTARNTPPEFGFLGLLTGEVTALLMNNLNDNHKSKNDTIRTIVQLAQTQEPPQENDIQACYSAMRTMASHYRSGAFGFLRDIELAKHWEHSAALHHDLESMERLAVACFSDGHIGHAKIWATFAEDHPQASTKTKQLAAFIFDRAKELKPDGLTEDEKRLKSIYEKELHKRRAWREEQE